MPIGRPHFGKGLKFPIKNQFESQMGVDKILEDIQLLLLTSPGERVMRPLFGSGLPSRLWDNLDIVAEEGVNDIAFALREFEPRVTLIEVQPLIDRARGAVFFQIRMIILETNQEANLVFPFKPASEIGQR